MATEEPTAPEATVTLTVSELKTLVSGEVAKALAAAPVTKEDLKDLIDIHGRSYKSGAVVRTAKGGTVVKED